MRQNARLEVDQRLPDGSYLSRIYASTKDRRKQRHAIVVRVVEYRLKDAPGAEPIYWLITTILDPAAAPAKELAALCHERWAIEASLDELKTHLRGAQIVLRSKTPELVRQEFYGLLMAHYAVCGLMHEAALRAGERSGPTLFSALRTRGPAADGPLCCYSLSAEESPSRSGIGRNPSGRRQLEQA